MIDLGGRNIKSQILKKERSILEATAAMSDFSRRSENKVIKENDIPESLRSSFIYVNDEDLIDDPDNMEDYGGYEDTEKLIEAMKAYGFQGVILAYPYKDKYMIESGHRRRYAGREAGIKKFPVLKTEPPKYPWEKTIRRVGGNLHNRNLSPMVNARQAERLFLAHRQELDYKKKSGLLKEGDITAANALVAIDLEVNDSTVERYRALLKLIPPLQDLADSGNIPWMILSTASSMNEDSQNKLLEEINKKMDSGDTIGSAWLDGTIKRIKLEQKTGITEESGKEDIKDETASRGRRISAGKISKSIDLLNSALCKEEITVKKKDIPSFIEGLELLKANIESELERLKNISG